MLAAFIMISYLLMKFDLLYVSDGLHMQLHIGHALLSPEQGMGRLGAKVLPILLHQKLGPGENI